VRARTRTPRRLRKLLGAGIALLGAGVLARDFWHYCLAHAAALYKP